MLAHRATLIQDIREYRDILRPALNKLLEEYAHTGVDEESALKWIIEEELELIYCLISDHHIHNHPVYSRIHSQIQEEIPYSLSILTSQYIKAPKLYDENHIQYKLDDRDLYMTYYAPPPPFVQYIPAL